MRKIDWAPLLVLVVGASVGANAADVVGFRDAGGLARSAEVGLPLSWSATENVVWRTPMPGPGTASPIVLGDRIYLTSYTGYGLQPNEGDQANLNRQVLCLSRATGATGCKSSVI